MRTGSFLAVLLLLLDLVVLFEPAQSLSFVKISIPTAFALITAAVKIKAIILKILFGLRAFGVQSFYVRRRRKRFAPVNSFSFEDENELSRVWLDLQRTVGRDIEFELDACVKSIKFKKKPMVFWGHLVESELSAAPKTSLQKSKNIMDNSSHWVSGLIGSVIGTAEACHILQQKLQYLEKKKSFLHS